MPKCAIKDCKNSSNNTRIRDGVSFFHYPRDPELAKKWWNILSSSVTHSFKPRSAVVCSDHFRLKDKQMCKKRHRLAKNAIPDSDLISPWRRPLTMSAEQHQADSDSSDEENTMIVDVPDILQPPSESTVCRLCLLSEGRMERVCEELEEAYRQVTGVKWDKTDTLPQHACWECAVRVRGAARLRRRALTAHTLLVDVRSAHCCLTLNDVKLIDRSYHNLTSKLSTKHFPPNQYLSKTINNNQIFKDKHSDKMKHKEPIDATKNMNVDKTIEKDTGNNEAIDMSLKPDDQPIKPDDQPRKPDDQPRKPDDQPRKPDDQPIKPDDQPIKPDNEAKTDKDQSVNNINTEKDEEVNFNVEKVLMNTEVAGSHDDSDSDCLVIDAEDELETVIKSAYVNRSDDGMPIDELIDIYNNDGDGDERLQELNNQFDGATVQVDQGWGGCRTDPAQSAASAPEPCVTSVSKQDRPKSKRRYRRTEKDQKPSVEPSPKKPYEKLDRTLFTLTPVTNEQQIAEIQKRKETYRFQRAPFKCHICYRGFRARRAYSTHMLRHDETSGAYECPICKARRKSQVAMRSHTHSQHTVRITCNQCHFVTMNRSVALSHQKWHGGKIFQCQYCPSEFGQETSHRRHQREQHALAHACPCCGYTFVHTRGLLQHRLMLHARCDQIHPDGPYCEACELRFASPDAHARHLTMSSRHRTDNEPKSIGLRVTGTGQKTSLPNATAVV